MGGSVSSVSHEKAGKISRSGGVGVGQHMNRIDDIIQQNLRFDVECTYPLEMQVAHYTPSSLPLTPIVTKHTLEICASSWAKIIEPVERDGTTISGITLFYTEFYDTLDHLDKMGKFEQILLQHAAGMDPTAAKGAILIRIINFALAIDPESDKTMFALYALGKAHNHKRIRPWQYSTFIETLMNTLSSRLGSNATHEVMNAWSNLFAFILRAMLPQCIKGLVNETEANVNVTTEVGNESITDEIAEADQIREMNKKLAKDGSRNRSRGVSQSNSQAVSPRLNMSLGGNNNININNGVAGSSATRLFK